MTDSWDFDELEAERIRHEQDQAQDLERRIRLLPAVPQLVPDARGGYLTRQAAEDGRSRRLLEAPRWPDGASALPVETPASPTAAWVAEVRRLYRAKLITRDEARAYLGLGPLPWHRRLHRLLRRLPRFRVQWVAVSSRPARRRPASRPKRARRR